MAGESESNARLNETSRQIENSRTEFARAIVEGKHVMIIVKTLAQAEPTHEVVFARLNRFVVGTHSPHVRGAVDEPRGVERVQVTDHAHAKVSRPSVLIPQDDG